jgi:hypothetical protein
MYMLTGAWLVNLITRHAAHKKSAWTLSTVDVALKNHGILRAVAASTLTLGYWMFMVGTA